MSVQIWVGSCRAAHSILKDLMYRQPSLKGCAGGVGHHLAGVDCLVGLKTLSGDRCAPQHNFIAFSLGGEMVQVQGSLLRVQNFGQPLPCGLLTKS